MIEFDFAILLNILLVYIKKSIGNTRNFSGISVSIFHSLLLFPSTTS